MSQNFSSSSRVNFGSEELKDYHAELDLLRTEEHEGESERKRKKRLIEPIVSSSLREVQNVLTSLRWRSFKDLSITQFQEFFTKQQGTSLDPEVFGCNEIEDVIKHASEKTCFLVEDIKGSKRISTKVEDADIVSLETLERNQEDEKLLLLGRHGLYKVSLLESVSEVWIHNFSQEAERIKLDEEMSTFYRCSPLHFQVENLDQCVVGRLLAARYLQMVVRVVVKKVLWSEEMIRVIHVDYGTTEKVSVNQLFFLHRKFLSWPVLVTKVRLWGLRPSDDQMLEELGKLRELVREEMEMGLVVEVMAVEERQREPSVVFHQLLGESILNLKMLTSGHYQLEPSDFHTLAFQVGGGLGVVEKMVEIISEKAEQGHCDVVLETAWATMWNATDESPLNCQRFLATGGMCLVLKCKRLFPDKAVLLENMTGLLGNLAEVPHLRPKLMTKELVEEMADLLDQYGMAVSYNAAGVLAHLASDGAAAWTFLEPGREEVLERLGRAVSRWDVRYRWKININYKSLAPIISLAGLSSTPQCQMWAVWALANLTSVRPEEHCSLLLQEGGLALMETILQQNCGEVRDWARLVRNNLRAWQAGDHQRPAPGDSQEIQEIKRFQELLGDIINSLRSGAQ